MSRNVNSSLTLFLLESSHWPPSWRHCDTAGIVFPVPAHGPSLLVVAATLGIAFLASLAARPRWRDKGADEHAEADGLLWQADAAESPRLAWARSVGVLVLPIAFARVRTCGLSAEVSKHAKIIVARGDGIAPRVGLPGWAVHALRDKPAWKPKPWK